MEKKGQLTFFIIAGIVILILVSLVFIYKEKFTIVEPDIMQPEFMPIKEFVASCIQKVGEEAIQATSYSGGYVNLPDEIANERESYLSFFPNSMQKIPYWYYKGESRIPSLETIQIQLSNDIKSNVVGCLNDFKVFENEFDISKNGEEVFVAEIGEEEIIIKSTYPLKVKDKASGDVTYLTNFQARLPVRFKKVYELAKKIMQAENKNMFLENITLDLMAMNPKIPFTGMEFECGRKSWFVNNIKKELKEMLYQTVPVTRVYNTNYAPFLADETTYERFRNLKKDKDTGEVINLPKVKLPDDAYQYFHQFIDVDTAPTDLKAGFFYNPDWELKLNARPSSNGVMQSNVGQPAGSFINFMCLNLYHFTYDVKYPVLVSVKDENAFSGKGYILNFAIPVLIDHNQGSRVDFGDTVYTTYDRVYTGLCQDFKGPAVDVIVKEVSGGLMPEQVKGANVSYDCHVVSCYLGETRSEQGDYKLKTQLPNTCSFGDLVARKEGYLEGRAQYLGDSTVDNIYIIKLREFDYKVVMHKYGKTTGDIGEARELPEYVKAYINIQNNERKDFAVYRDYPADINLSFDKMELLEADSSYKIDILLEDTVDNVFIGGYRGDWKVKYSDIISNNQVIFHVIEMIPKPLADEEQLDLINLLEDDKVYKKALQPEFK